MEVPQVFLIKSYLLFIYQLIYDGTKGNIATADLMKQEPVNRISTGSKFIDNLTIYDGQAQFGNAVVRDQKPNNSSKSFLACTEA